MAPKFTAKAITANTLQQRITALDRSSEDFSVQITEAFKILEIDRDSTPATWSSEDFEKQRSVGSGPKEEWFMRWLLKRLNVEGVQEKSLCVHSGAWILLRILIARLPISVAARMLSTLRFTTIVELTLQWLHSHLKYERKLQDMPALNLPDSGNSSSSATLDVPLAATVKKSRKRKRNDAEVASERVLDSSSVGTCQLYIAICSTLRQAATHTEEASEGVQGFAAEHMKAAIKCSPKRAAKSLGNSLRIAIHVLNSLRQEGSLEDTDIHATLILPMVSIWNLRSVPTDDLAGYSSNLAFSTECLVPSLQFLHVCSGLPRSGTDSAILELEKMIAGHIILPSRAAFLHQRKAKVSYPVEPKTLCEELLAPLSEAAFEELRNLAPGGDYHPTLDSISFLFDLSLRCYSLKISKQRIVEAPWLQRFFVELARCASLFSPIYTTIRPHEVSVTVLKQLLHFATSSKIHLDAPTLNTIFLQISGLSDETFEPQVDWDLVSLCMQNDENLILPAQLEFAGRLPQLHGRLLTPLLARATNVGIIDVRKSSKMAGSSEKMKIYATILNDITIPLVGAFVHARNLTGFIDIWQTQLVAWQDARSSYISSELISSCAESIWEDDKLLDVVASKLEMVLTSGQISKVLRGISDGMQSSLEPGKEAFPKCYAGITILDCVLNGINSETTVSATTEQISQILTQVSTILSSYIKSPQWWSWRLWRILATIFTRWPESTQTFDYPSTPDTVLIKAQSLVNHGLSSSALGKDDIPAYAQDLYVLGSLLALLPPRRNIDLNNIYGGAIPALVKSVVKSIKQKVDYARDHPEVLGSQTWLNLEWDGHKSSVDTPDMLLLCHAVQIILATHLLSCLEATLVRDLFTQLYWCACLQAVNTPGSCGFGKGDPAGLSWAWLWKELLNSSKLGEEALLVRALCQVQVSDFEEDSFFGSYPDLAERYNAFRIRNLLQMPVDAFAHQERAKIANKALFKLLDSERPVENSNLRIHVDLLIRCMERPSKIMELVSNPKCLWSLAGKSDRYFDVVLDANWVIPLYRALRQLTQVTLCHLIVIGTNAQSQASGYLEAFYESLSRHIRGSDSRTDVFPSLIMVSTAIKVLWEHRANVTFDLSATPSLADLRQKHFEWTRDRLTKLGDRATHVWQYSLLLESLQSHSDTFGSSFSEADIGSSTLLVKLSLCAKDVSTNPSLSSSAIINNGLTYYIEEVSVLAKKLLSLRDGSKVSAATMLEGTEFLQLHTIQAKRSLLQQLRKQFSHLDPARQAELISLLVQRDGESLSREEPLLQLQTILACHDESNETVELLKLELARTFSTLCDRLGQPTTIHRSILRMQCMNILLRLKPRAILQWHIDSLLSIIAVMTSISGPKVVGESAGNIFLGLCRLFASLLAVHRTKLGGRFHLVVVALQGLLRCLFEPYTKNVGSGAPLALPPWLESPSHPLNETHAAAYSRLLTAICDPAVSAVTRTKNRSRQQLNDETKKARSIAGQHLQYLIMEFCQCQLRGRLPPEVRAALNPGLYAAFDAMNQETMRTINSALDSSGRSIFKVLYDDYRQFGRWQGS